VSAKFVEISFAEFHENSVGLLPVSAEELFGGGSFVEYENPAMGLIFRYEAKPVSGKYFLAEKWFKLVF
jgi:hypothetical protein